MTKKCLTCNSTMIDDLESGIENEVPRLLNCDDKYNPNKIGKNLVILGMT